MPWGFKKSGSGYAIYRKDTGEVVGHSATPGKAWASIQYREAGSSDAGPKSRKHLSSALKGKG